MTEPRFHVQSLDSINYEDLQKWVRSDELVGLVDEEAGGIIGYINEMHANIILAKLNGHKSIGALPK